MSQKNNFWPYAIALSILAVFGASVATVVIASSAPVQKSDIYMMDYHEADDKANEIINANIAFDELFVVEFVPKTFKASGASLGYSIKDKNGNGINNAKLEVVLTRPDSNYFDVKLKSGVAKDGFYGFENIKLPKDGRWDIMAKIRIGNNVKFYNLKADTRSAATEEY